MSGIIDSCRDAEIFVFGHNGYIFGTIGKNAGLARGICFRHFAEDSLAIAPSSVHLGFLFDAFCPAISPGG